MTPLVLQDYTPIPKGDEKLCRDLQSAVDQGDYHIINLSDFMKGKLVTSSTKGSNANPDIFSTYNGDYCAQEYAGILEFEGRTIIINSRFDSAPQDDPTALKPYFLQYCLERIGWDAIPLRHLMDMQVSGSCGLMIQLLIPIFLHQVQTAFQVGTFRQYRNFEHNDSKLRGPIDIPCHIRLNPIPNGAVAYNTREYTLDNPTNRLILAAKAVLEQRGDTRSILQNLFAAHPEQKAPFQMLGWELGEPTVRRSQVRAIIQENSHPITHPFHRNYEAVRQTALMILEEVGLNLLSNGAQRVTGLLIPMTRVWELLLEKTLFDDFASPKVFAQSIIPILHGDGSEDTQRQLKPDFIAEDGAFVLEAKYKRPWTKVYDTPNSSWSSNTIRGDMLQILAYTYAAHVLHKRKSVRCGIVFPLEQKQGYTALPETRPFDIFKEHNVDQFFLIPYPVAQSAHFTTYEAYRNHMDNGRAQQSTHIQNILLASQS